MKLRNKKTGEIDDFLFEVITDRIDLYRRVCSSDTKNIWKYNSLAELNEEWEDYAPKEPLIKDEKIRKAVRAWAEANDIQVASFYASSHHWYLRAFNDGEQGIDFWLRWEDDPELVENKRYTIIELCGEEEE